MRALVYVGPGSVALREVADPVPAATEVLIEVTAAGMCGTDRHIVDGHLGVAPGTVPGHEVAGRILEVGTAVDGWDVGMRVLSFGQVVCGTCPACEEGRDNRCRRPEILGMARQGGFAERIAIPPRALVALPEAVPDPIGAITSDAIATPFHALFTVGRLTVGETVVIIGAGGLGMHAVQLARLAGAGRIVAVDPSPDARAAALGAGADAVLDPGTEEDPAKALRRLAPGAGLALECVGRAESVELALDSLTTGGRVIVVGVGSDRPRLPPLARFVGSEISVRGAFGSTRREIRSVLDLITSGRLDTSHSISRLVPLADAVGLFAAPPTAARTVLLPQPTDSTPTIREHRHEQ